MRMTALRRNLTPEVLALCLIIFFADVVAGIMMPTFSLYASSLGVSLALLGILNTTGGLIQLATSLPMGILSDRIGRPRIVIGGLVLFTLAVTSLALANGAPMLFVGRILFALAGVATFQMGAAYLGDVTTPEQRPFAFGLYATAMGLGFTVGPILGSQIADRSGYEAAYFAGTLISVLGILVAWLILRRKTGTATSSARKATTVKWSHGVRAILKQRDLMLVTFGNTLVMPTFSGAISTFFPIYGKEILLTQATIGTMFAVRAMVSTLGRLPNGIISNIFGNQAVMLGALGTNVVVMFGIARTTDTTLLTVLLGLEGLAFGAYLVSGQTYVADHTDFENRGTAMGVYSMAASFGSTLAPLVLGIIADRWGVATVFTVTGWTLAIGLILSIAGVILLGRQTRGQPTKPPSPEGGSLPERGD